jgi:NOL1/NOP2/fmu family ribosome biogenesis protein
MLNIRKAGIHAGSLAHGKFIPEHELAQSFLLSPKAPYLAVNRDQALGYLRKQPFETDRDEKGWFVLTYNGLSLGLIKHLGNRINNYYPSAWRILMS